MYSLHPDKLVALANLHAPTSAPAAQRPISQVPHPPTLIDALAAKLNTP